MADDQTNERYDDVDALLGDLDDDEEESYASDASDVAASGVGSILGSSSLSNLETIAAEANATEITHAITLPTSDAASSDITSASSRCASQKTTILIIVVSTPKIK